MKETKRLCCEKEVMSQKVSSSMDTSFMLPEFCLPPSGCALDQGATTREGPSSNYSSSNSVEAEQQIAGTLLQHLRETQFWCIDRAFSSQQQQQQQQQQQHFGLKQEQQKYEGDHQQQESSQQQQQGDEQQQQKYEKKHLQCEQHEQQNDSLQQQNDTQQQQIYTKQQQQQHCTQSQQQSERPEQMHLHCSEEQQRLQHQDEHEQQEKHNEHQQQQQSSKHQQEQQQSDKPQQQSDQQQQLQLQREQWQQQQPSELEQVVGVFNSQEKKNDRLLCEKQQHVQKNRGEILPPLFRLFLKYSCNLTLVGERVCDAHFHLLPLFIYACTDKSLDSNSNSNKTDDISSSTHCSSICCSSREKKNSCSEGREDSSTSSFANMTSCNSVDNNSRNSSILSNILTGKEEKHMQQAGTIKEEKEVAINDEGEEEIWASLFNITPSVGISHTSEGEHLYSGAKPTADTSSRTASAVVEESTAARGTLAAADYGGATRPITAEKVLNTGRSVDAELTATGGQRKRKNHSLRDYYLRHIRLHIPTTAPLAEAYARFQRIEKEAPRKMRAAGSASSSAPAPSPDSSVSAAAACVGKQETQEYGPAFSYGMLLLRLSALRPRVREAALKAALPFGRVLEEEGVLRRVYVEEKLHIHVPAEFFIVGLPTGGEENGYREDRAVAGGDATTVKTEIAAATERGGDQTLAEALGQRNDETAAKQVERPPGCTCEYLSVEDGDETAQGVFEGERAGKKEIGIDDLCFSAKEDALIFGDEGATKSQKRYRVRGTLEGQPSEERRHENITQRAEEGTARRQETREAERRRTRRHICAFGRWSVMVCDGKPAARVLEVLNAPLIFAAAAAARQEQQQQQDYLSVIEQKSLVFGKEPRRVGNTVSKESTTGPTAWADGRRKDETPLNGMSSTPEEERKRDTLSEEQIRKDLEHLQSVCLCSASRCLVHKHWLDIPLLWGPPTPPGGDDTVAGENKKSPAASPCFNCKSTVCVTEFSTDAEGKIVV